MKKGSVWRSPFVCPSFQPDLSLDLDRGFFSLFAALKDLADIFLVRFRQDFLGGGKLLLFLFGDMVKVFFLEGGKAFEPSGRSIVARRKVGHQLVQFLMLGHGMTGIVRGGRFAQDSGPQGLILGIGVGLGLFAELLEKHGTFGRRGRRAFYHGQKGAVLVVIFDQTAKDFRIAPEGCFRCRADTGSQIRGKGLGFGNRSGLGLGRIFLCVGLG